MRQPPHCNKFLLRPAQHHNISEHLTEIATAYHTTALKTRLLIRRSQHLQRDRAGQSTSKTFSQQRSQVMKTVQTTAEQVPADDNVSPVIGIVSPPDPRVRPLVDHRTPM